VCTSFSIEYIGGQPFRMAKSSRANAPIWLDKGPAGFPAVAVGPDHLATAAMRLLPAVNEAVTAHRAATCLCCTDPDRHDCPVLGLASAALDLIIRCWRIKKSERDGPSGHSSRDLRAAVRSKWLTDSESDALAEIIEVLDLAVAQADDAGMNLPKLAGVAVAVVDGYRAISQWPRPTTPA
jgi:hypothetical protein